MRGGSDLRPIHLGARRPSGAAGPAMLSDHPTGGEGGRGGEVDEGFGCTITVRSSAAGSPPLQTSTLAKTAFDDGLRRLPLVLAAPLRRQPSVPYSS